MTVRHNPLAPIFPSSTMNKRASHPIDVVCRNHQDGAYHCPQCDTPFSRRSNLRRHYQIHLRDAAHKCSNCNKDYPNKDELQDHLVVCYASTWNQSQAAYNQGLVNSSGSQGPNLDSLAYQYSDYSAPMRSSSTYTNMPVAPYPCRAQKITPLPTLHSNSPLSTTLDLSSSSTPISSYDDPLNYCSPLSSTPTPNAAQAQFSHHRRPSSSSSSASSLSSSPYVLTSSTQAPSGQSQMPQWANTAALSDFAAMPTYDNQLGSGMDQLYPRQPMRDMLDVMWFQPTNY